MPVPRKLVRDDAFARALKETFGHQTSLAKVEEARQLYALYRTQDILDRSKGTFGDTADKSSQP